MKKRLLVASSVLLLANLGVPTVAAPDSSPTPKPTETQVKPATQPKLEKPRVELIDAGSQQSRQQLRYKPVVNTKETATLTLDMDMKMQFSGNEIPTKLPSTVMKMETTVTKVEPNGDIHYSFRYVDSDIANGGNMSPRVADVMRSQMKQLNGITGTFVIDDRGQVKSANFKIPKNIDPNTKQMLDQMSQSMETLSAALPAEPVGVGAKWRVIQPFQAGGIALTQVSTYELISVNNGVVTMKGSVSQDAKSQRLTQPGLPSSMVMTLKSMTSTGEGDMQFRLDRLMPTKSTLSMVSNSEMEVSNSAKGTPMSMRSEMLMQMTMEGQSK